MIENYILIIGAMKSGTTTLFDMLARHSKISACHRKEPGFFAFEEVWVRGFEWYESLFDFDPGRHVYGLDASTDYTKHPFCQGVQERLAASEPRRFKLIYIMRHPLRRMESHARHVQLAGREVGSFRSPCRDHGLDNGVSPVSEAISDYAAQLDRYRSWFDTGDLLLLSLEDLIREPVKTLATTLSFLDLEQEDQVLKTLDSNKFESRLRRTWLSNRIEHGRLFKFLNKTDRSYLGRFFRAKPRIEGRFHFEPAEEQKLAQRYEKTLDRLEEVYRFSARERWKL